MDIFFFNFEAEKEFYYSWTKNVSNSIFNFQLEDLDVLLSDHIQKVLKTNFAAAWEEVTAKNELEDTYAFNLKTLEGK